jgi:hypothetical protein
LYSANWTLAIYDDEEDTIHFQGVLFSLDGKKKDANRQNRSY